MNYKKIFKKYIYLIKITTCFSKNKNHYTFYLINEHKNILKMDNLHFLPKNIITRLFKELKYIYIYI